MSEKDIKKTIFKFLVIAIITMVVSNAATIGINSYVNQAKINRNTSDIWEHSKEMKSFSIESNNISQHQVILNQVLQREERSKEDFNLLNDQLIRNERSLALKLDGLNENIIKLYQK